MVPAPFDLLTPDFKNVATGQLCLHTLSHKCTPPSHKKWGLETNLCLIYIYCTVGGHAPFPAFSRELGILKCLHTFPGAQRTTYPRFGIVALREKKFSQMECHLDKAPQKCCLQDLMVQNVVEKQFLR